MMIMTPTTPAFACCIHNALALSALALWVIFRCCRLAVVGAMMVVAAMLCGGTATAREVGIAFIGRLARGSMYVHLRLGVLEGGEVGVCVSQS
jgi:hypothetical protein